MTDRLYYTDCFLSEFDATVTEVRAVGGRTVLVLDRSAFYPTSGGQVFDTGTLDMNGASLPVEEVAEDEHGEVLHFISPRVPHVRPPSLGANVGENPAPGTAVHGVIDLPRRRDHMQQHTGQHVLSAAFVELFGYPTVSFHMGDESCTIDLDTKALNDEQVRAAEQRANEVIFDDRTVEIRFASVEQARAMGVRKIPPDVREQLRLIDIRDFDLNACGGTHVARTGQIGPILLRKTEKVKQGVRVEFVCGERAVRIARRDFETLTEAAAVFSAHIWSVAEQIRKSLDEIKSAQKERKLLLEEVAELQARALLSDFIQGLADGERSERPASLLITRVFPGRDLNFVKLLAQKLTDSPDAKLTVLFAAASGAPALVFAQSAGGPNDMGQLMKETMAALGSRGGGNRDLAQGGVPAGVDLEKVLAEVAARIR